MHRYQEKLKTTAHYRAILNAKTSIPQPSKPKTSTRRFSLSNANQHTVNNKKILRKLVEINQRECRPSTNSISDSLTKAKTTVFEKKSKNHNLIDQFKKKQYEEVISHENQKLIHRIMGTKSTLDDMKKRKQVLNKYRRLSRKHLDKKADKDLTLLSNFRKELLKSRKQGEHNRHKKKKSNRKSSRKTSTPIPQDQIANIDFLNDNSF